MHTHGRSHLVPELGASIVSESLIPLQRSQRETNKNSRKAVVTVSWGSVWGQAIEKSDSVIHKHKDQ